MRNSYFIFRLNQTLKTEQTWFVSFVYYQLNLFDIKHAFSRNMKTKFEFCFVIDTSTSILKLNSFKFLMQFLFSKYKLTKIFIQIV